MLKPESPAGALACGVFLCLLLAATASRADFFLTRNQNPFTLFQGQPLPLPASVDGDGWQLDTSLDIANTLNLQNAGNQSLYVDFESYYLNIRLQRHLGSNWLLNIDLPLLRRGGGVFDSAIDKWHQIFGLPRASRPYVTDNQYTIRYLRGNTMVLDLQQDSGGAGDVAIGIGHELLSTHSTRLALWLGAELPSGDRRQLRGNGHTDFSLTLAAQNRPHHRWQLDMNLGLVRPGGDLLTSSPAARGVLYSYLAASWQAGKNLQLSLQLEMHQSYYRERRLALMDSARVLVFGGSIALNACQRLHIGFSEDIDVGASPDIALLVSWRSTRDCQKS